MFGTPTCLWCGQATKHFGENRVPSEEVSVERDPAAARDLLRRKTAQTGVPVIEIGASPTRRLRQAAIERELARKDA